MLPLQGSWLPAVVPPLCIDSKQLAAFTYSMVAALAWPLPIPCTSGCLPIPKYPPFPPLPCPVLQIVQLFDSWAHHLSPEQYAEFSQPYSERIIAAVRALASELFRLHSVSIDRQGLWVYWSHAPELWGPHRPEHRFVPWADVAQLQWDEDGQEHEFKQYLLLTLHAPLSRRRRRLKLRVCEERDLARCQALMALLPPGTPHPAWLDGQRSRWPVVGAPAPCPAAEPLV